MKHLTPEQFVDLAEGRSTPGDSSHVERCEACRRELEELRGVMALAAEAPVPEPSPLFWGHFSARVREAVAVESVAQPSRPSMQWSWQMGAAALAAAVLVMAIISRGPDWPHPQVREVVAGVTMPAGSDVGVADYDLIDLDAPSLVVADLAGELGWQEAVDAGLGARAGAVARLVPQLTEEERVELQRLLQDELARSGA